MSWQPTEITGFSAKELDDADFCAHLIKELGQSLVLVFREMRDFDVAAQVKLTKLFGETFPSLERDIAHPEDPIVQLLSRDGTPENEEGDNSYFWHSDRSYLSETAKVTMLHAQIVSEAGGETEFANMHLAYDIAVDKGMKLDGLRANHSYTKYHREIEPQYFTPNVVEMWAQKYPDTIQPLVKLNPYSHSPALYLSQLCLTHIVDLPTRESELLLDELYKIALQDDNIYRHQWHVGDLVVWSNVGLMHQATRSEGPRKMHRTIAR